MPRVIKRTPDWLVPPSPGHSLFSFKAPRFATSSSNDIASQQGALRTIAKGRGSEIFVASGNELRWADLAVLKHDFQEVHDSRNGASKTTYHYEGDEDSAYRVRGNFLHALIFTLLIIYRSYAFLELALSLNCMSRQTKNISQYFGRIRSTSLSSLIFGICKRQSSVLTSSSASILVLQYTA